MRRRPRRPPSRYNPPTSRPVLPFLLRCSLGHLVASVAVAVVQIPACSGRKRGCVLEGMHRFVPVHFFGIEKLMAGEKEEEKAIMIADNSVGQ